MANGENTPSCVEFFAWLWWTWVATHPLGPGKAKDIAYEDVFREFDKVWCVKGLIVTCSISDYLEG